VRRAASRCIASPTTANGACARNVPPGDSHVAAWVDRNGNRHRRQLDDPRFDPTTCTPGGWRPLDFLAGTAGGYVIRIQPLDGQDTGRKWLADLSRCLAIQPGEGFCRG
jgi:hypothetical protein